MPLNQTKPVIYCEEINKKVKVKEHLKSTWYQVKT